MVECSGVKSSQEEQLWNEVESCRSSRALVECSRAMVECSRDT